MRNKDQPDDVTIKGLQIRMAPDKNIKKDVSNLMIIGELKTLYLETLGEKADGLTKE